MAERDPLEVDVLFVGAGPASLAGAIRLRQLAKAAGHELEVLVIEKAGEIGNHGISGAVMDPQGARRIAAGLAQRSAGRIARYERRALVSHAKRQNQSADHAAAAATITASTSHRCRRSRSGSARRPKRPARKSFRRFPGRNCCGTAIASSACAPATKDSTTTATEIELRAGRRHPGEGRRAGRRPARHARQAGRSAAGSRRRPRAASLRGRR